MWGIKQNGREVDGRALSIHAIGRAITLSYPNPTTRLTDHVGAGPGRAGPGRAGLAIWHICRRSILLLLTFFLVDLAATYWSASQHCCGNFKV